MVFNWRVKKHPKRQNGYNAKSCLPAPGHADGLSPKILSTKYSKFKAGATYRRDNVVIRQRDVEIQFKKQGKEVFQDNEYIMNRKRMVYIQMCTGCFLFIRFAMHVLETIEFVCIVIGMLLLLHEIFRRIKQMTNEMDQTDTSLIIYSDVTERIHLS